MSLKSRDLLKVSGSEVPLARNQAFNFAKNHSIHIYQSNSVYTFIPKNACSTMRLSIAVNNGFVGEEDINWIHANNQTFKPSLKELAIADFTFVILRNPFYRLASAYLDKIINRDLSAWSLYKTSNRSFVMGEISFSEFVTLITSKPNLLNADAHWRKQSDFLIYKSYDRYFQFEDFEDICSVLGDEINLEILDTRASLRHDTSVYKKLDDEDFSQTSADEILSLKRNGKCPSHMSLYTQGLKGLVRRFYKSDFDLYEEKFGAINDS